jgi:hypothetical protein
MNKLQQTGQNLGWLLNSRSSCAHAVQLWCFETKLPNLKLKTRPEQLIGYLPLDIALPESLVQFFELEYQKEGYWLTTTEAKKIYTDMKSLDFQKN